MTKWKLDINQIEVVSLQIVEPIKITNPTVFVKKWDCELDVEIGVNVNGDTVIILRMEVSCSKDNKTASLKTLTTFKFNNIHETDVIPITDNDFYVYRTLVQIANSHARLMFAHEANNNTEFKGEFLPIMDDNESDKWIKLFPFTGLN